MYGNDREEGSRARKQQNIRFNLNIEQIQKMAHEAPFMHHLFCIC